MEFKHLRDTTRKRLKILRILSSKTYEEIIDTAVGKYYDTIIIDICSSTDYTISFTVPHYVYEKFCKSALKAGLTPSDLLSYIVDLWVKDE